MHRTCVSFLDRSARVLGPLALAAGVVLLATLVPGLGPGIAEASGGDVAAGDKGLATGAIIGIAVSFILAAVLLMVALPFILPKPPGK
ncbi:MAG TPA: F0F1 ATP synthase subunit C [Dehalococcoidia bacterium]|nr:F0F1 ATP synthase subunit C [Dehalococcoidia bacterium]